LWLVERGVAKDEATKEREKSDRERMGDMFVVETGLLRAALWICC